MAGIVVLCLAYIFSQFYRSFLAVLTPALIADIGVTKADLSLASGLWFAAFALMQFGVGVSLDTFGPRRTAAGLFGIAGGAGVALFSVAQAPWMIIAAMGLIGIGCSPVLMSSFYIFARTRDAARFAFLASVFIGVGNLGNIIGAAPMAAASEAFGWRTVTAGLAVMTVAVGALIFAVVRDPQSATARGEGGFGGYLTLLRIPVLWLIIPAVIVHYAAAAGIRGLWAGPYLTDVFGADALAIGQVTLWMAIAMAIGSIAYGPLDTYFNSRKWVAFWGALVGVAALAFMALVPASSLGVVTFCLIVIGMSGLGYGVFMAHARTWFPPELTGRGVTLMNFGTIGGVAGMQIASGRVATAFEVPGDPAAGYTALFAFYAVVLAVALAIYLFAPDARPRPALKAR